MSSTVSKMVIRLSRGRIFAPAFFVLPSISLFILVSLPLSIEWHYKCRPLTFIECNANTISIAENRHIYP